MTQIICEECGRELSEEEEVYEILSKPDESFKTRRLAVFCSNCGKVLLKEFRKEYGENAAIEV